MELSAWFHRSFEPHLTALSAHCGMAGPGDRFCRTPVFLQDSIYTLPLRHEGLTVLKNHYIVEGKVDGK